MRYFQIDGHMKSFVKKATVYLKMPFLTRHLLKVEKRVRFVSASVLLTAYLLFTTFFSFDFVWIFVPLGLILAYGLTYLAIIEDIEKVEWGMLFIMPVLFTAMCYSFYFLFPVRWLTRIPFLFIYSVSIYALFLTSNIFNVGVEKSLRLYKAAFSVNYFFQTFLVFLSTSIIFSLREYFIVNAFGAGIISYILALQLFWTIKLDLQLSREVQNHALFVAVLMAETAIIVSFLPLRGSVLALMLAATYYSLSGLTSAHLDNRLFRSVIREYIVVLVFVWLAAGLTLLGW